MLVSAIALPLGMTSTKPITLTPAAGEVFTLLTTAVQLLQADLAALIRRGEASYAREATRALAMVAALEANLGHGGSVHEGLTAARLLDASAAVTLCRDRLREVAPVKSKDVRMADDLRWIPRMQSAPMNPQIAGEYVAEIFKFREDVAVRACPPYPPCIFLISIIDDHPWHEDSSLLRTARPRFQDSQDKTEHYILKKVECNPLPQSHAALPFHLQD
jgi:hypothetical protein